MDVKHKYIYLCAVNVGDKLYAATIDGPTVSNGDLVVLDNGVQGTITRAVFSDAESECYKLFTDFLAVDEIVEVYHRTWNKAEESEDK